MPRPRNIGVIGHGAMGRQVARMLTTEPELTRLVGAVTVGTRRPRTGEAPRSRTALPEQALPEQMSPEQVIADPRIDAVVITTPTRTHESIALSALEHGKHVLVEKPVTLTASGAEHLRAVARRAGLGLQVVSQHRWAPAWEAVHRLIGEGSLGRVSSATVEIPLWRSDRYFADDPARVEDQLWNLAHHELDLAIWCLGPVERIAFCETVVLDRYRSSTTACLVHRSGCVTTASFTSGAFPGRMPRVCFNGSTGTVVVEGGSVVVDARPDPETVPDAGLYLPSRPEEAGSADWLAPYRRQLAAFFSALDDDPPPALDDAAISTVSTISSLQNLPRERG
ncbi:Gfo/Idh/MocA family protein [Rathayibacter tanaceti]|uniref:Gfo/Idh/MocA family oxidoreductase n=2 Tax=Rathayibacter tanaceti TaxID=1671680 RepID=A0A166I7X1_9MICO|nr:Gfo/Idh/MocA family oxidoreductase [Rathayibacter tanaceti]KZX21773.1 putative oxidoreductase YdgJ [Rathayibacter tanaceti]QHC54491.1 Gfo/Idh/MocA family oxidoreductase [Rathayibacter tanaceti]TCO35018.1 putative dehydrogenase [Rathayibacter tanaceti]